MKLNTCSDCTQKGTAGKKKKKGTLVTTETSKYNARINVYVYQKASHTNTNHSSVKLGGIYY